MAPLVILFALLAFCAFLLPISFWPKEPREKAFYALLFLVGAFGPAIPLAVFFYADHGVGFNNVGMTMHQKDQAFLWGLTGLVASLAISVPVSLITTVVKYRSTRKEAELRHGS